MQGFPVWDLLQVGHRELKVSLKHIDRRHFFVRECVERHQLRVPYVNTADNLAYFFTKPLAAKQFYAMRDQIMNVPRRTPVP